MTRTLWSWRWTEPCRQVNSVEARPAPGGLELTVLDEEPITVTLGEATLYLDLRDWRVGVYRERYSSECTVVVSVLPCFPVYVWWHRYAWRVVARWLRDHR